jgi:hypothetical protein
MSQKRKVNLPNPLFPETMLTYVQAAFIMDIGVSKLKERILTGGIDVISWGNEELIPYWQIRVIQEKWIKNERDKFLRK